MKKEKFALSKTLSQRDFSDSSADDFLWQKNTECEPFPMFSRLARKTFLCLRSSKMKNYTSLFCFPLGSPYL
ncbi:MAG: hypothetical protein J6T94_11565 [Bacteroidaceae bacterium]|nr:hypothetical protein [Bacteroidaceae bacterium]